MVTLENLSAELASDLDRGFEAVVLATQHDLFSGVLRLVNNRADAEEVTQDAYVRAYTALRDYAPTRIRALNVRPWLWTIAINLCRNRARRRSRRPPPVQLHPDAEGTAPDDPARDAAEAADARYWSAQLAKLTEDHRTAVVLRHVVGLSYQEISDATGKPIGTVKADVHRGLERLRGNHATLRGDHNNA